MQIWRSKGKYGAVGGVLSRLLIAIFLLRALIPTGFMPDYSKTDGNGFQLVICTGAVSKTIAVDADGQPLSGGAAGEVGDTCVFSSSPVASLLAAVDLASPAPVMAAR